MVSLKYINLYRIYNWLVKTSKKNIAKGCTWVDKLSKLEGEMKEGNMIIKKKRYSY